jgi:carboxymethylenebutenolidase
MQTRDVELGYLATPDAADSPGLVLVHDVWGLGEHTRDMARRFAARGFSVLALDLYRRKADIEIPDPGAWLRTLSDPEAIADVREGAAFLAGLGESSGKPVGVVGFCMGGTVALLAACAAPEIAAVVPFYGLLSHEHGLLHDPDGLDPSLKPRSPLAAAGDLRCPALCFFGDADPFVPMSDIDEFRKRLAAARPSAEVVVYPGAGHAFMNDSRPDAYDPAAADDAWQRTLRFLDEQLSG